MKDLPRRSLLCRGMQLAAGFVVAPCLVRTALAADVCVDPESESLRASLNYIAVSADAATTCGNCAFFSADESASACGGCAILSGPVDATGHCDSWSPQS